ncbi:cyclin-H-like [Paramacrobiotus metropolitanus]|uniref:cyclin-H-like n=1 Tax=Paramacrobiotus metropolitanus TaxID=2943436 RepID=UPI0024464AC0|nr:cyclin-H-like [Paramacrobiotus metropolitanus]
MYHSSTQRKFWTFANEEELQSHRRTARRRFVQERLDRKDCSAVKSLASDTRPHTPDNPAVASMFLSIEEEAELCRFYQTMLRDFCSKFKPELPRSTIATGFALFQRSYVNESVMRLHPKYMMITCMWIAVKADEYHITMEQFVAHLRGDRQKAIDIILNNEPYVMKRLHYHLMVHLPYRAMEGFLIDIKTRFGEFFKKPDRMRPGADKFLEGSMFSDTLLLWSPSQIALAALFHAAEELKEDLTDYVEKILVQKPIGKPFAESGDSMDKAEEAKEQDDAAAGSQTSIHLLAVIDAIRHHVKESAKLVPNKDRIKKIEAKLEGCRDPAFNPETEEYQKRINAMMQLQLEADTGFD